MLEKRLHLREASRECGLFFGGKPIERGIDHLTVEQLVGAVGLPAFRSVERHKHLPTIGLATCALHKTLGHKLADGRRK